MDHVRAKVFVNMTPEEIAVEFGRQLRDLRLRCNLDQRELAESSGIALNAVKRLESGRGATVASLISLLRRLDRADWLFTLAPQVSISPIDLAKRRNVPRQRAGKSRKLTTE